MLARSLGGNIYTSNNDLLSEVMHSCIEYALTSAAWININKSLNSIYKLPRLPLWSNTR